VGFKKKKIFNALANRKKIRFCIVAKNKIMLSPARKKKGCAVEFE
jgi:hypothetical protein